MKKINVNTIVFLVLMAIFSFSSLVAIEIDGEAVKLAEVTIIFGLVGFFVNNKKTGAKMEGLRIKEFPACLKSKKVIILVLIPIVLDIVTFIVEKSLFPEVLRHIKDRTDFVTTSLLPVTLIALAIAALGEEIAWRAFFQKQTTKAISFIPSIIITSVLFAICHFSSDAPVIVAIDLGEIFINSIFYGLIFKETDNAWCSWVSHFLANVVAMLAMLLFIVAL